ncbi:peptide chain release factor 1 [Planosporangium thailandense]|uniref:Peptide chain release factor 1 n=1 Tax=Planosporangium thailandense TaxID=765197 RepID=A0ABX0Y0Z5_9ACTN|nr:Vms1/Ankzf1 family peptidyl-tRNA hydrolase [Planosporangium thailandense]NJC71756.1 peptide chain release factor 1 [Planosporangium thailandense]
MHLSMLRPLAERPGPWASVLLDASHESENATKAIELRWRAAREELSDQGADTATLDALENVVLNHDPVPGQYWLAAFASHGEVALSVPILATPLDHVATFGPLPHAMPMISGYGEQVAWLRIVVNRVGADFEGATVGGVARRGQINGHNLYPLHRAKAGGWSYSHHWRATQMTWQRNAQEIAEAVAQMASDMAAEAIIVAGEAQARRLLIGQLPEWWQKRYIETDVGVRAPGADPDPLDDVTLQAVAALAAQHVSEVIDAFKTQRGRDAAAGVGLAATVSALQRAQVDTVLLVNDLSSTAKLWVGETPSEIAMTAEELREMGTQNPIQVRADAALLRALAATDADLVLVSPDEVDLDSGVGALLRYADASTRRR